MKTYYIGADVHCNNTELAIEHKKRIISRFSVKTDISSIAEVLDSITGRKYLTFEEGPMAGWLYRNLKDKVDKLIVCDPRRNKLIVTDGDKTDQCDAAKLAELLRGKYIKEVYHTTETDKLELKRWVGFYYDKVKACTSCINQIRAHGRMYGMKIPAELFSQPQQRQLWMDAQENKDFAKRILLFLTEYDTARLLVKDIFKKIKVISAKYPLIKAWQDIAGIGPIRAATFYAYVDTPFRFNKKSQLWKYCGLGIKRHSSGKDKNGNDKPSKLKLEYKCNRKLKDSILGAVRRVINLDDNEFKEYYEQLINKGVKPSNARHAVGRKMITIMWGMWKSDSLYVA